MYVSITNYRSFSSLFCIAIKLIWNRKRDSHKNKIHLTNHAILSGLVFVEWPLLNKHLMNTSFVCALNSGQLLIHSNSSSPRMVKLINFVILCLHCITLYVYRIFIICWSIAPLRASILIYIEVFWSCPILCMPLSLLL